MGGGIKSKVDKRWKEKVVILVTEGSRYISGIESLAFRRKTKSCIGIKSDIDACYIICII